MRLFVRRRSFGIQARLTMLAVVTALPLVALASWAILRMFDDQRPQIQLDVTQRVEDLLADVDRQVSAIQAELQVLAVSPSLRDGDFGAFDQQMRAALTIRGTSIVLHDTKGQQLLSTNRPFGEPLPRATNTEMHDRVVATGKPQISDLIMGAVLRRPILVVGVPVFRDRQVVYVLAMGLGPEVLSSLLRSKVFRSIGRSGSSIARASLWRAIESWIGFSASRFRRRFWKRCTSRPRTGSPVSRVKASPYIRHSGARRLPDGS